MSVHEDLCRVVLMSMSIIVLLGVISHPVHKAKRNGTRPSYRQTVPESKVITPRVTFGWNCSATAGKDTLFGIRQSGRERRGRRCVSEDVDFAQGYAG